MAEIASAYVSLLPSTKGFGAKAERQITPQMSGAGKKAGSNFGKVFARSSLGPLRALGAAALGFFAVSKVTSFFKSTIAEAREAQKVGAQTNAVIKATGGAAGVTAGQVGKLAGALSLKTGIDDEVIQSGQNMLLTFKNIKNEAGRGNDIFNQTTKTLIDMSAAMGSDPKQAAIQLGKALNDPVKGVSALSKVGVTFTEDQKKVIASLVKTGKTSQAQRIILKELNSEFGGSAAAQATAGEKAAVAWGNLKEQIGTLLLPIIDRLAVLFSSKVVPAISTFVAQIQSGEGAGGRFVSIMSQIGTVLGTVFDFIRNNKAVVGAFVGTLVAITVATAAWNAVLALNPIGLVVIAIAALVAGLVYAYQNFGTFRRIVDATFSFLKGALIATIGFVKSHWKLIGTILLGPLFLVGVQVVKHWAKIKSVFVGGVSAVIGFVKGNWKSILATLLAGPFGLAVSLIVTHWDKIKSAVSSGINKAVGLVKSLPGRITSALGNLGSLLYNAGRELIAGMIRGITSKIGDVGSAMGGIAKKIKGYLPGSPVKWGPLTSWNGGGAGARLMGLLATGIGKGSPRVAAAMKSMSVKLEKALLEGMVSMRDKVRSQLSGLKSDFASLRDSIVQAFTGDIFGAAATEGVAASAGTAAVAGKSAGQNFISGLMSGNADLKKLLQARKTLLKWGWSPQQLSRLFASGNTDLILELAGSKSLAAQGSSLLARNDALANQLGNQVARADIGPRIDITNVRLGRIEKALHALPKNFGHEINKSAKAGKRKGGKK